MTPESTVKRKIKKLLDSLGDDVYCDMPVPGGYGKPTLDYVGCYLGVYFAIEAKALGKKPTPRQEATSERIRAARGAVFTVDGPESLDILGRWFELVHVKYG